MFIYILITIGYKLFLLNVKSVCIFPAINQVNQESVHHVCLLSILYCYVMMDGNENGNGSVLNGDNENEGEIWYDKFPFFMIGI